MPITPAAFVILKTGSAIPPVKDCFGDFEHWIEPSLRPYGRVQTIDTHQPDSLPDVTVPAIITGSPAMVTDAESWMLALQRWLRGALDSGTPVLGICFGHQLLAAATGGQVAYHPQGREIGSVPVRLTGQAQEDPLFRHLPIEFQAQVTHAQTVLTLPPNATLLGGNEFEPHQAFRMGECAWGVQFHPEFTAEIMRAYIDVYGAQPNTPLPKDKLLAGVRETPAAASVLTLFGDYCVSR